MSQYTFDPLSKEGQLFRCQEAKRKIALLQALYSNTASQPVYQTTITAVNTAIDNLITAINA